MSADEKPAERSRKVFINIFNDNYLFNKMMPFVLRVKTTLALLDIFRVSLTSELV